MARTAAQRARLKALEREMAALEARRAELGDAEVEARLALLRDEHRALLDAQRIVNRPDAATTDWLARAQALRTGTQALATLDPALLPPVAHEPELSTVALHRAVLALAQHFDTARKAHHLRDRTDIHDAQAALALLHHELASSHPHVRRVRRKCAELAEIFYAQATLAPDQFDLARLAFLSEVLLQVVVHRWHV